ncbi:MAG: FG-GAP repeat protein [Planctomycetes bacterium]|nr:FG-GAP repeat protein [Planctomycetota bacterium]
MTASAPLALAQDKFPSIPALFETLKTASREKLSISSGTPPGTGHIQGMTRLAWSKYALTQDSPLSIPPKGYLGIDDGNRTTWDEVFRGIDEHPGNMSSSGNIVGIVSQTDYSHFYQVRPNGSFDLVYRLKYKTTHGPALVFHPVDDRYYLLHDLALWQSNEMDFTSSTFQLTRLKAVDGGKRDGNGGTFLIYDANDTSVLYNVALRRQPGVNSSNNLVGWVDNVHVGKLDIASRKVTQSWKYTLQGSWDLLEHDPSSSFVWGGSIYVDQYSGFVEVAAAPRNNGLFDFHRWRGSIKPATYTEYDRSLVFQDGTLLDVNAGTGARTVLAAKTSKTVTGVARVEDVLYTVQNGRMERHNLADDPLPPFDNADQWTGVEAMTGCGCEPGKSMHFWGFAVRAGKLVRFTKTGEVKVISSGWEKSKAMAVTGDKIYILREHNMKIGTITFPVISLFLAKDDGSRSYVGDQGSWMGAKHMTSIGDRLYIVKDEQLFEVRSNGTSRVLQGNWSGTTAIGASADNMLAIVKNGKLYRSDPHTGGSRQLSNSWTGTMAIVRPPFRVEMSRRLNYQTRDSGVQTPAFTLSIEPQSRKSGATYQWYKDTRAIAGETSHTLTRTYLQASDRGLYSCEVSGLWRSSTPVRSRVVFLQVAGAARRTQFDLRGDFGSAVTKLGDFDADGYDDYAVGGPTADTGTGTKSGIVTIHSGKDQKLLWNIDGSAVNGMFGSSLVSGDFDNDGVADLMIGSGTYHAGANTAIYMLSGLTRKVSRKWQATARIGQVMAVGDFDRDAYPDVVHNIGTRSIRVTSPSKGVLWNVSVTGSTGNVWALAVIGDRNGDGIKEVVVGMPDYDPTNKRGRFEILSGKDGSLLFSRNGAIGDELGASIVSGGSLRGSWNVDFAIGSPGWNGGRGKVEFIDGWLHSVYAASSSIQPGDRFGTALAAVGDQDLDGNDDIVASGSNFVRVLSGADAKVMSEVIGAPSFGQALAAIDTNGDSTLDLVVGEPTANRIWCYDRSPRQSESPASYSRFGETCGSTSRAPRIAGSDGRLYPDSLRGAVARVGRPYRMFLLTGPWSSFGQLRIGTNSTRIPLDVLGMNGCVYYVDSLVSLGFATDKNGAASVPLSIPNDPAFTGVRLLFQWLLLDQGANKVGLTLSDCARVRIGAR